MSQPCITCFDMRAAGVSSDPCCGSCHDDEDDGYEMCTLVGDSEHGCGSSVCCAQTHNLTEEQWQTLLTYMATKKEKG